MKNLCQVAIATALLAACSQPGASNQTSGANAPQPAAAPSGERFYGQESFTLVTRHGGQQSGTTTLHVRDWGRLRAEINDTTLIVSGVTVRTRNRVVYDGARVVTIDSKTGRATAITNPLYDKVVAAMRGRGGVEFGQEIMTSMGGRKTGERGAFAGHDCDYWQLATLDSRTCVTPWGATLHQVSALGGIRLEQTVSEVRIGDRGPEEAFAYDAAAITEAPNLNDLRRRLDRKAVEADASPTR